MRQAPTKTSLTDRQRYQLEQRRKPSSVQLWGVADGEPEGTNGGFMMAGQGYNDADVVAILLWMFQRARDYPCTTA
jgi:hypothetical protein